MRSRRPTGDGRSPCRTPRAPAPQRRRAATRCAEIPGGRIEREHDVEQQRAHERADHEGQQSPEAHDHERRGPEIEQAEHSPEPHSIVAERVQHREERRERDHGRPLTAQQHPQDEQDEEVEQDVPDRVQRLLQDDADRAPQAEQQLDLARESRLARRPRSRNRS